MQIFYRLVDLDDFCHAFEIREPIVSVDFVLYVVGLAVEPVGGIGVAGLLRCARVLFKIRHEARKRLGLHVVQAGAQAYFGKDVGDLTLAECASIAAITKSPTRFSPIVNPENHITRRNHILGLMLEQGKIEARAPYAQVIVSKSCEVLTLEEYQRRMAEGR